MVQWVRELYTVRDERRLHMKLSEAHGGAGVYGKVPNLRGVLAPSFRRGSPDQSRCAQELEDNGTKGVQRPLKGTVFEVMIVENTVSARAGT